MPGDAIKEDQGGTANLVVSGTDGHSIPSEEHNTVHDTPVDPDNQPATPEFVADMVTELDSIGQERSKIFAERYSFQPGSPSDEPGFKKIESFRREDRKLREREDMLRSKLNDVITLVMADEKAEG